MALPSQYSNRFSRDSVGGGMRQVFSCVEQRSLVGGTAKEFCKGIRMVDCKGC